jgi:signal transduction histidine kinase
VRLIMRDAAAQNSLLERMRSTEQALEQIRSFSRRMNEPLEVGRLFELLVGEVLQSTGAQIGGVALRRGNLFVSEGYYLEGKYFGDRRVWKPEDPLTQWFLLRKVPCLSNRVEEDARVRAKQRGGIRFRTLLSTPIFDRNGEVIAFFGVANEREARGFDNGQAARMEMLAQMAAGPIQNAITLGKLDHASERFRRLSGRVLNLQDEERRRIAKLLHETTVQDLLAVKMNLGKAKRDLGNPDGNLASERRCVDECRDLVDESLTLANDAMQGVRTLAYVLHPPLLDESGLACALEWFVKGFAKRSEIAVEARIAGDVGRLPREVENAMFRVAQESLGNIHRHSGSPRASVRLWRKEREVILEIEDYGKGMISAEAGDAENDEQHVADYLGTPGIVVPGVGIAGMRERIEQFGGSFVVQSAPGRGTKIRVTMRATQEHGKEEGGRPAPRKFAAAGGSSRS